MSLTKPLSFSPPNSANNIPYITKTIGVGDMTVFDASRLIDDKTMILGQFNTINSKDRNFLALLDSKYNAESGFNALIPANNQNTIVRTFLEYGNYYIITGVMISVGGVTVKNIAMLNRDGSPATFTFPDISPSGAATALMSSTYVADRIYVAGSTIGSLSPLTVRTRMVALDMTSPTAATIDSAFNLEASIIGDIYGILDDPYTSGHLLLYGNIVKNASPLKYGVCRITTNGVLDTPFASELPADAIVYDAYVNPVNGSLLVGGYFGAPGDANRNLRRLDNNGVDTGAINFTDYDANSNFLNITQVRSLCNIPSGGFTDYILIGGTTGHVYMMNSLGAPYVGFGTSGYLAVTGGAVYGIKYVSDDCILLWGAFTAVEGVARSGFAVIDIAGNLL